MRRLLVTLLVLALLLGGVYAATMVVSVHHVPTDSMEPTVEAGSWVVVADRDGDDVEPGEVVVFHANGNESDTPVLHRTVTYVEEGEDWMSELEGQGCDRAEYCPAPNDGYITRGDDNLAYDQESGISQPVETEWIEGVLVWST